MSVWQDRKNIVKRLKGQKAKRLKDLKPFYLFTSSPFHRFSLLPFLLLIILTFPSFVSLQSDLSTLPPDHLTTFFHEALDFSDLDVRDSRNRPVRSQTARENLAQLFSFSVVQLLVSDALPIVASFRRVLEKLLAPLSEGFHRAKKWLAGKVFWAIAFAVKKFSDLFALSPFHLFTLYSGDSDLRGASRLIFLPLTAYHLPLNLPLLC